MTAPDWMRLDNAAAVPSPALVLYDERIEANLRRMLTVVGDVTRLRPHLKTHKLPQLITRQLALGIRKFKCATIAEAELAAAAGAPDVLLALQPVGPNVGRLIQLIRTFPQTQFSTLVDDPAPAADLNRAAVAAGVVVEVLLDLEVGQGRTGIAPGPAAVALYRTVATLPGLRAGGLHAYDGHLRQRDPAERAAACDAAFSPVDRLRAELLAAGLAVPRIVAGGTPTFPGHARRGGVECSPGTCVLSDAGYDAQFPDLGFAPAAALLARVVSRPARDRLCLDLGHKAVASEMPHPRVIFPALPDARAVVHSEEHLVVATAVADDFPVGTVVYGIPWHICPTVALHSHVHFARQGRAEAIWPVVGRARCLTV